MAICNSVQTIQPQQCIGDSLPIINTNFSNLNTDVCTLLTLINELSSNMNKINLPYIRIGELVTSSTDTFEGNSSTRVSTGNGAFKRVLNTVDVNYPNTNITLNTTTGVMTVPAGAYDVQLSMGNTTSRNTGSGISFSLGLRETSTTNYVFKGVANRLDTKKENAEVYAQQGKIYLTSSKQLELCLNVYGTNTTNNQLYVSSGTLQGGINLFTVEFWRLA